MNLGERGQVAAITGAARGLGRELAVQLAAHGWSIAIGDIDRAGSERTRELVNEAGGEGVVMPVDTSDAASVQGFADGVFERWGRCDLLVNNAGVVAGGLIGEVTLEDWSWCLGVNLLGPIHGCHAFVPRMMEQRRGHIVNVASAAAFANAPFMAPYNVSKAGLVALGETLRAELRDTGLGVTIVCPWFFRSGLAESVRLVEGMSDEPLRLIKEAPTSASAIARATLDAIRRNEPLLLPQREARIVWRLGRLLPRRATALLLWIVKRRQKRWPPGGA